MKGRAYLGCDLSKISKKFLLKIWTRFFKDPLMIFNKNLVEIFSRSQKDFKWRSSLEILLRSHRDFIWRTWEELPSIFKKLMKFLKVKKNWEDFYLRSSKDLKKILIEDRPKLSERFYSRSLKDLKKILVEDLNKI